jgi:D-methionine transport system permease protein
MSASTITLLFEATFETLMVGVATAIAAALGVPLGIVLVVTGRGHILERTSLGVNASAKREHPSPANPLYRMAVRYIG